MGLIAVAMVLAAQASQPVIVQNEQQLNGQFAGLPCFVYAGAKQCVRSIVVSGKKKDMNAARAKLTAEGWSSVYRAGRSDEGILDIDAKNRTLDEAWALTNRFASKEFGPLQADFFTLPVPGSK